MMALALVAGFFLAVCQRSNAEPTTETTAPATTEATTTSKPTTTFGPATTRKAVDVSETQQGQPVPRNLLE